MRVGVLTCPCETCRSKVSVGWLLSFPTLLLVFVLEVGSRTESLPFSIYWLTWNLTVSVPLGLTGLQGYRGVQLDTASGCVLNVIH